MLCQPSNKSRSNSSKFLSFVKRRNMFESGKFLKKKKKGGRGGGSGERVRERERG